MRASMLSHQQRPVRAAQAFICSRTVCKQEAAAFCRVCVCVRARVCVHVLSGRNTSSRRSSGVSDALVEARLSQAPSLRSEDGRAEWRDDAAAVGHSLLH